MLNWAHIHLLLTHIPMIGIGVVIAFLVAGRVRESRELEWVSLQMIVALAVLSIAVYLTGSPASHEVREMAGISRETIHQHSNVADFAFWTMEILGALSLAALVKFRTAAAVPSRLTAAILVLGLVVLGLMARTALLNLGKNLEFRFRKFRKRLLYVATLRRIRAGKEVRKVEVSSHRRSAKECCGTR